MDDLQGVIANPRRVEDSENPSSFSNLDERGRRIGYLVMESRKARGLPTFETDELLTVIYSWSKALREIANADLQECYEAAIASYTDPKQPFGTPQMLKAWQTILDERRRRPRPSLTREDEVCYYCDGTGWQSVMYTETRKVMLKIGESKREEEYEFPPGRTAVRPCACSAAPASMRSNYPLRGPTWEREKAGRWWQKVQVTE